MRTVINSDFKEGRQENTRPSTSSNAIFLWKTALRVYEKVWTQLAIGTMERSQMKTAIIYFSKNKKLITYHDAELYSQNHTLYRNNQNLVLKLFKWI